MGRDVTFRSIIKQYMETFSDCRSHVYLRVLLRPDPMGAPTYGSVVKFYNDVYVPELKGYALSLGESGQFDPAAGADAGVATGASDASAAAGEMSKGAQLHADRRDGSHANLLSV